MPLAPKATTGCGGQTFEAARPSPSSPAGASPSADLRPLVPRRVAGAAARSALAPAALAAPPAFCDLWAEGACTTCRCTSETHDGAPMKLHSQGLERDAYPALFLGQEGKGRGTCQASAHDLEAAGTTRIFAGTSTKPTGQRLEQQTVSSEEDHVVVSTGCIPSSCPDGSSAVST